MTLNKSICVAVIMEHVYVSACKKHLPIYTFQKELKWESRSRGAQDALPEEGRDVTCQLLIAHWEIIPGLVISADALKTPCRRLTQA